MKNIAEMTHDELMEYAAFCSGLSASEIQKEFKTDDAIRVFLNDAQKLRGSIIDEAVEAKVGWDSTDTTEVDDEIKKLTVKKKVKLAASIKKTGSKVSVSDVQNALNALNDDDDEDDGSSNN